MGMTGMPVGAAPIVNEWGGGTHSSHLNNFVFYPLLKSMVFYRSISPKLIIIRFIEDIVLLPAKVDFLDEI